MFLRDIPARALAASIGAVLAALPYAASSATPGASLTRAEADGARPVLRSARRDFADNETFRTAPGETLEVLLSDGTSIVLAAGSEMTLTRYVYDRASRAGELALRITQGTARVTGGTLNNSQPIELQTPFGTGALRNGIALVEVGADGADLTLVVGDGIDVTAGGRTISTAPGASRLHVARDGNVATQNATTGSLRELSTRLNPGLAGGAIPTVVDEGTGNAENPATMALLETGLIGERSRPTSPTLGLNVGFGGAYEQSRAPGTPNAQNGSTATTSAQQWAWSYRRDDLPPSVVLNADGTVAFAPDPADVSPIEYGPGGNSTFRLYDNAATGFSQTLTGVPPRLTALDEMFFVLGTSQDLLNSGTVDLATRMWLYDPNGNATGDASLDLDWIGLPFDTTSAQSCSNGAGAPCVEAAFTFDLVPAAGTGFFAAAANTLSGISLAPSTSVSVGPQSNYLGACTSASCATFRGLHAGFQAISNEITITGRDADDADDDLFGFYVDTFDVCFGSSTCAENDPSAARYAAIILNRENNENLLQLFDNAGQSSVDDGGDADLTYTVRDVSVARDHFLYIEGRATGTPTEPDTEIFLYSTGFASGRGATPGTPSAAPFTVDHFTIAAGLTGLATRSFVAPSSSFPLQPFDTGLWVINPATDNYLTSSSRMLHGDFALGSCTGGQCSTISLSLGTLSYDAVKGASAAGRTMASTRGYAEGSERILDTETAWASAVAGGGNPVLGQDGRAGYLVLDNYFPGTSYTGGSERPVAGSTPSSFAITRLAVADQTTTTVTDRAGVTVTGGFVSGFADRDAVNDTGLQAITTGSNGVTLTASATDSSVSGTLNLRVNGVSSVLEVSQTDSAYLDRSRYGAFAGAAGSAPTAALVSAGLVLDGWAGATTPVSAGSHSTAAAYGLREAVRTGGAGARHLQWGFFFGDLATPASAPTQPAASWHAHLTPWVGGQLTSSTDPLPTGTATYSGYAIGNVLENGVTRSAIGSYANTWNFASRSGIGTLEFDTRLYPVRTELAAGNAAFNGFLLAPVQNTAAANVADSFGPRVGALEGSFMRSGTDSHAAVAGQFTINRESGAYQAAGVFGAER